MKSVFLDFATISRGDIDAEPLDRVLPDLQYFPTTEYADLHQRVGEAEIILTNKIRIDRQAMIAAAKLKLICLAATGANNVDLEAAREHGISVCNIVAYCTDAVVQHVFALIMSLNQHLREYQSLLQQGAWKGSPQFCLLDYPIRELAESTLGIVGYGELGRGVAKAAEAFGMKVLLAQRPGGDAADSTTTIAGPERLPLAQLLPKADVLSLHCPLTPETENLIGTPELELMPRHALLINTARGALVDEQALLEALEEKRIGGAGIDVLSEEPPVNGNVLLDADLPNLIVTPHIAWATREARQRALNEMAANVADFLDGGHRNSLI
ncbi:MAG: D-2-hydroxyacid dehydrogenase [Gammaproteobacteria bacterium]|nr:D-2-hydroxyacid dehydrogenase [Gammaproteobacteria bacterium]